jgi:hypothetical protein
MHALAWRKANFFLRFNDLNGVLIPKFQLGLFDRPFVDANRRDTVYRSQQHLAVSLRSARESMKMLKNDRALLPISKSTTSIAVIGPNVNVARYGDYEKEENGLRVSLLDGLRKEISAAKIEFDEGKDISAAVDKAERAEVVILGLGEKQGISGEGFDRTSLDLPGNQEQLLEAIVATGKPVVLVLENGRPLTIFWAKAHVPAIIEAWYPGELGGQIAETLSATTTQRVGCLLLSPATLGSFQTFTMPIRRARRSMSTMMESRCFRSASASAIPPSATNTSSYRRRRLHTILYELVWRSPTRASGRVMRLLNSISGKTHQALRHRSAL